MKLTLVIMAAGLGSRFGKGNIKQLEKIGPNGELLMDYSIDNAIKSGFTDVIFVIRRDIEKVFKETVGNRVAKKINAHYAYQELEDIPLALEIDRKKPWGTGHALLSVRHQLDGPFVVINADDYYGPDSFEKISEYLKENSDTENVCMVAFEIGKTISEKGPVTRGICVCDEKDRLKQIKETKNIQKVNGIIYGIYEGKKSQLSEKDTCSMNMWGGTANFISQLEKGFVSFLETTANLEKDEFLLPVFVNDMIKHDKIKVKTLPTTDEWVGITFQEDVEYARNRILQTKNA